FTTARQLHGNWATLADLGYAYAVCGQPEKAGEALAALTDLARQRYVSPDCQAIVAIGLGDREQAFSWLEQVVADRSEWLSKFGVDPVLDPLRSAPRFQEMLRKVRGAGCHADREQP